MYICLFKGQSYLPDHLRHLLHLRHYCPYDCIPCGDRYIHTTQLPRFGGSVSSIRYVCTLFSGIGCAIIFTGVPVYFIVVSDDYVKKPESVRRFLGEQIFQEPSGVLSSL